MAENNNDIDYEKLFIKKFDQYPKYTSEEINDLVFKAQNGDIDARNKVILSNLYLVLKYANRHNFKGKRIELMDLFQEGILGIISAIYGYDPEKSQFSTYANYWVKNKVRRLKVKNNEDHVPVNIMNSIIKYKHIVDDCNKNNTNLPSDIELCEMLEIDNIKLSLIKEYVVRKYISVDSTLNDEDETLYEEVISINDDQFQTIDNNIDHLVFCYAIKQLLNNRDYFVFYYTELVMDRLSLRNIMDILSASRQNVNQIYHNAYNKVKEYMSDIHSYKKDIDKYNKELINTIEVRDILPLELNEICKVIYEKYFTVYDLDISDQNKFNIFKEELIKKFKFKIFYLYDANPKRVNRDKIDELYFNLKELFGYSKKMK